MEASCVTNGTLRDAVHEPPLRNVLYAVVLAVGLAWALTTWASRRKHPSNIPPLIDDHIPWIGSWGFWSERWSFTHRHANASETGNFSFYIGPHLVIALTGTPSRKTYFESKQFDLVEGYQMLMGTTPQMTVEDDDGKDVYGTSDFSAYYLNRLNRLLRRDAMQRQLPLLVQDTQARFQELKDRPVPITDPFESIYNLVYQLVVRAFGCKDLADNRPLLEAVVGWYDTIAQGATMMPVVFPWFPSINQVKRVICGIRIYRLLSGIVNERKGGKRVDDPMQELVDLNDKTQNIVAVIMGAIFTAQTNSNINVAWFMVYLASSPYWKAKIYEEVERVADKYEPRKDVPMAERLASLPLEAWENEFPILDLCSKDSLRLGGHGSSFRQNNSGKDVVLPTGEVIPNKAFAVRVRPESSMELELTYYQTYHLGIVHQDPEIYPDPLVWDPTRHLPENDETAKKPLGSLVWGVGRHPCVGMKFAKLEQTIILALFLANFDEFSLCDREGNPITKTPSFNIEQYVPSPPETDAYIKYHVRA